MSHKPHVHHTMLGDGGYKSRKWFAFLVSNFLLLAFAGVAANHPALVALFPEYATAVVAVFTVYLTGNVTGKLAIGKVLGENATEVAANKDPTKPATPPAAKAG